MIGWDIPAGAVTPRGWLMVAPGQSRGWFCEYPERGRGDDIEGTGRILAVAVITPNRNEVRWCETAAEAMRFVERRG